ncbi:MAG: HAMP domain-containing sensor histidine kinase [Candidatus Palauibacterales bacterium]|nr:HAMP domain-containing sensor histidine kinase [Candidatus Palauibacterales bacterium]
MIRRLVPFGIVAAFSAVLVSYLVYTWQLSQEMRANAAVVSHIYFQVVQAVVSPEGLTAEAQFQLLLQLYELEIPFVQTDLDGNPTLIRNLPFEADLENQQHVDRVRRYVVRLDEGNPPLVDAESNFVVHYGEPLYLQRLRWIPWLQAILLLGVVGTGVWTIRTSSRSERERIWTAMARESAHQMGTPLSSLVGWLELLEATAPPEALRPDGISVLDEMEDDVRRLEKVSRRFELIGRRPALRPVSIYEVTDRLGRYFRARTPSLRGQVKLEIEVPRDAPPVLGNETLLEWAFENLFKNSLDSLAGRDGRIEVTWLGVEEGMARLRFADDGPGVDPALRKRLFDVGVTTKQGGWGVGLSLVRRIFVHAHKGRVALEPTETGAVFTIALPLARTGT